MTAAPAIVGIRRVSPTSPEGQGGILALLVIEHGPWLVDGFALMQGHGGNYYLRPPRCSASGARVVLRNYAGRDDLVAEALRLSAQFAETPVAKAPRTPETIAP